MTGINPEILGKIILLQSTLHVMSDDAAMARFVCRGLSIVPGIESVSMYVGGSCISENDASSFSAEELKRLYNSLIADPTDKKNSVGGNLSSFEKNNDVECLKIETIFNVYGLLVVKPTQKELYLLYKPYIENTLNLIALVIETNSQKYLLLKSKENLEKAVEERTKELRESEKRFRTVFEDAATGIALVANDGCFMQVNQTMCRLLGYTEEEFLEKTWIEMTEPADLKGCYDWLKGVKAGEQSAYEKRFIHKLGHTVWVMVSSSLVRDSQNRILYYISLFQDITAQKQAEQALQESEKKYKSLFDSIRDAILVTDTNRNIIDCNPAFTTLFGYSLDEIRGKKTVFIYESEEQFQELGKALQEHRGDTPLHKTINFKKKNDGVFPGETSVFHLKDQSGNVFGFIGLIRDITERVQAEKALRESEEKYRNIYENAIEGFFQSTPEGRFISVNPAFARILGYASPEELIDSILDVAEQFYVRSEDRRRYQEVLEKEGLVENFEFRAKRKDGSQIWISNSTRAYYDENGNVVRHEGIVSDISERKRAEEFLEASEERLRQSQKMEAIGTLAGGIAHDFNNILFSMIGFTELALDEAEKGTMQHQNLQEVLIAGSRAKNLVQQILTFSRQADQEQKPVQVKLVAKEALGLLRASIPSTIEIEHNIQSNALIMGDSTQIHQVLMNLCTNAAHAMEKTGGVLAIDISDVELDSEFIAGHPDLKPGLYVNLTVTDTGHGMSPDVLEKLYDPFFTTKEKGEGTGMGLAVVHGIVHSHGGTIYVYSEPGKGSTFRVFLPAMERLLKPEDSMEKPIATGTEKVLFIDDEPAIVNMGKQILESLGYNVVARTSGIEALEFFKTQPNRIDLVVTDMTMPKMTGDILAHELLSVRSDIPVILCTGFSSRMDEEKAKTMGIRALISKPILKREMADTIRRVLDEK